MSDKDVPAIVVVHGDLAVRSIMCPDVYPSAREAREAVDGLPGPARRDVVPVPELGELFDLRAQAQAAEARVAELEIVADELSAEVDCLRRRLAGRMSRPGECEAHRRGYRLGLEHAALSRLGDLIADLEAVRSEGRQGSDAGRGSFRPSEG